jgi:predicted CXXCH cytochrome family protein
MMAKLQGGQIHFPFQQGMCGRCHTSHASERANLITETGIKLCSSCHSEVSKQIEKEPVVHQPLRKGLCISCHNPHGSKEKGYLPKGANQLCLSCHTKLDESLRKTGAFVHSPMKQDGICLSCHTPHVSTNEDLLLKKIPQLCSDCHNLTDQKLVKSHSGFSIQQSQCLGCHESHVSNRKGLFNEVPHSPFIKGECIACHEK